jgi:hypothetical protein
MALTEMGYEGYRAPKQTPKTVADLMKERPGSVLAPTTPTVKCGSFEWIWTPALSAHYMAAFPYEHQRTIHVAGIDRLSYAFKHGTFQHAGLHLDYCFETRRWYCTNGKHRFTTCVETGIPFGDTAIVSLWETYAEIVDAYTHRDSGTPRTLAERQQLALHAARLGMLKSKLVLLNTAMPNLMDGFASHSPQSSVRNASVADVRTRACLDWITYGAEFFSLVSGSRLNDEGHGPDPFRRAAVVALGVATTRYANADAREYWKLVAEDDGLIAETGEWATARFLTKNLVRGMGQNEYARRAVRGWNVFYTGGTIAHIGVRKATVPIEILGTPYHGLKHLKLDYANDPILPADEQYRKQGVQVLYSTDSKSGKRRDRRRSAASEEE